jgi:dCMP deaminase
MEQVDKVFWLNRAYDMARYSHDSSTQVGAVIMHPDKDTLECFGSNQFPVGVSRYDYRLQDRSKKLLYMEHAERNAIYDASYRGVSTKGAWMFAPFFSCADCARGIIQSGIARVIGDQFLKDQTPARWKESIDTALQMFIEAGVDFEYVDSPKIIRTGVLFDGKPLA